MPEKGISAAEHIANISVDELEGMLIENADEPYAFEIAKTIVSFNKGGRGAILTFHSGEDRLVNPRAKSTKMRWRLKHK